MKNAKLYTGIYLLLLFVIAGVAVEWASGILLSRQDQGTDPNAGGRHLYHPFRSHQLNPDYLRAFDSQGLKLHSPDGFRSDVVVSKDKPAGVFRIIMMGGSTMYGIGAEAPYPRQPTLKNTETISAFLQHRLNEQITKEGRALRVEVINAAVTAYTTFQHLQYFNETLYEYRPDLIIFLDGHNDFYHYQVFNNWQTYRGGTTELTHHFNQRQLWFTSLASVRFLAQYSRFFMVVEKYLQRKWPDVAATRYPQFEQPRTVDKEFPRNVDAVLKESIFKSYVQFQALGKLFNFDMMVFLQPQIALENADVLSPIDQELKTMTLQHEINPRRAEIRPLFAAQFTKYGIAFADISEIGSAGTRSKALYIDYCHLSPAGSAVVAERMVTSVLAKIPR
jgi:lysophospholipase L1-like esterase